MWARMQFDRWNIEAEARQEMVNRPVKLVKESIMKDVSAAKEKDIKSPHKKQNPSEETRSC